MSPSYLITLFDTRLMMRTVLAQRRWRECGAKSDISLTLQGSIRHWRFKAILEARSHEELDRLLRGCISLQWKAAIFTSKPQCQTYSLVFSKASPTASKQKTAYQGQSKDILLEPPHSRLTTPSVPRHPHTLPRSFYTSQKPPPASLAPDHPVSHSLQTASPDPSAAQVDAIENQARRSRCAPGQGPHLARSSPCAH